MTRTIPGASLLKRHPELVLRQSDSMRDAMEVMTKSHVGFIIVADAGGRLVGIVNDADLRRALLQNVPLDAPVTKAVNRSPLTIDSTATDSEIAALFQAHPKSHIPVIDRSRRVVGLAEIGDYEIVGTPHRENWVTIMAGGLGRRLAPLTEGTPKPMLPVGDKPILELLLEQFRTSGFRNFLISVNHLADQVIGHFGDGSRMGLHIEYLRETKPLGTVGALSLIKRKMTAPILVANGDILTKINFGALLDFHESEKAAATVCIKSHEVQIPYGVIDVAGTRLQRFVEKPVHRTYVNAGIYVLEPSVLRWIPKNRRFDMPELISSLKDRKKKRVSCFPIQEYWIDIGEMQSYRRAAADYAEPV